MSLLQISESCVYFQNLSMFKCGRCDFKNPLAENLNDHIIEEHGFVHLKDFTHETSTSSGVTVSSSGVTVSTRCLRSGLRSASNSGAANNQENADTDGLSKSAPPEVVGGTSIQASKENNGSQLSPRSRDGKSTRGQTLCIKCGEQYNNNGRPRTCHCGQSLEKKVPNSSLNAFHLTGSLYSVREHKAGVGKRVVVDKSKRMCYARECLEVRAHYSELSLFNCVHVKACESEENAKQLDVKVDVLKQYVTNEETMKIVESASEAGILRFYVLPNDNVAMSSLIPTSHECLSGIVHLNTRKLKCPLRNCSNQPDSHFRVKLDQMCIHILLFKVLAKQHHLKAVDNPSTSATHLFSKSKTADYVINKIIEHIPSNLESSQEAKFLQASLKFQTELLERQDISDFIVTKCDSCDNIIEQRVKRPGNNLVATPGFIVEVEIGTSICKTCQLLHYPHLYEQGFVPISDNLLVSWSVLVDARGQLLSGNKMYHHFYHLLRRLVIENIQLARKIQKLDFHNLSIKLVKCAVSYNTAVLVKHSRGDDDALSLALCLHCGLVPLCLLREAFRTKKRGN